MLVRIYRLEEKEKEGEEELETEGTQAELLYIPTRLSDMSIREKASRSPSTEILATISELLYHNRPRSTP